ncbi:MAG: hypothetical protein ACOZQL_12825 [Myxococcota bacterium]
MRANGWWVVGVLGLLSCGGMTGLDGGQDAGLDAGTVDSGAGGGSGGGGGGGGSSGCNTVPPPTVVVACLPEERASCEAMLGAWTVNELASVSSSQWSTPFPLVLSADAGCVPSAATDARWADAGCALTVTSRKGTLPGNGCDHFYIEMVLGLALESDGGLLGELEDTACSFFGSRTPHVRPVAASR